MAAIVAKLRSLDSDTIARVVNSCGCVDTGRRIPALRMVRLSVPVGSDPEAVLATVKAHPDVERAGLDHSLAPMAVAQYHAAKGNDPLPEYHLKRMSIYRAWQLLGNKGSDTVRVAVVDSGLLELEDITPLPPTQTFNTTTDSTDCTDTTCWFMFQRVGYNFSHGTRIHGFLFAKNDNGLGMTGACPGCYPICIATGDNDAVGAWGMFDLAEGILKAVELGARLINCSWGWLNGVEPTGEMLIDEAFDYAWANGALCFVAAGNDGLSLDPGILFPMGYDHCLAIGATGSDDGRAIWGTKGSNYGSMIGLCAPGTGSPTSVYWSTDVANEPNGQYRNGYGTSFASPLAMGAAALALSANPSLSPQEIIDVLRVTADRSLDPAGDWDAVFPNAGIVNAARAVLRAKSLVAANAGQVFPYVGFWKQKPVSGWTAGDGPWGLMSVTNGVVTTTLDGPIVIDLDAYSSDPVLFVELRVGSRCVYRGPPTRLTTTASPGSGAALTVRAVTANGVASEETYTDVVLSDLALPTVPDVTYDSDTEWHIDVPTGGMSGTVVFDAVQSDGATASVSVRIPGLSRLRRGPTDRPPLKVSSGASFATAPVRVSTGTDYT